MGETNNSRQTIEARAMAVCAPLIAAEGLELLECEFLREREGYVLRLFVDRVGGSVGIEDCTLASQAVDTALDVEDFIPQEYSLEVSSPGLNRPLIKPVHYERVVGKKVKVKTFGPLGEPPRKTFTGVLKEVGPEVVKVAVDGAGVFDIPFKDIARANLEFEF